MHAGPPKVFEVQFPAGAVVSCTVDSLGEYLPGREPGNSTSSKRDDKNTYPSTPLYDLMTWCQVTVRD
jgi:hypothetical protein